MRKGKCHDNQQVVSRIPVAFHPRGMNMLYEGLKQNSTVVIVSSSAIRTMQLGGVAGLTL
jgi:hypothetical protein